MYHRYDNAKDILEGTLGAKTSMFVSKRRNFSSTPARSTRTTGIQTGHTAHDTRLTARDDRKGETHQNHEHKADDPGQAARSHGLANRTVTLPYVFLE